MNYKETEKKRIFLLQKFITIDTHYFTDKNQCEIIKKFNQLSSEKRLNSRFLKMQ